MRVFVGCETSGVVRRAFQRRGHEVASCDLLPSDDDSSFHIIGDVRDQNLSGFDIAILHPNCQRLCNSGVRWLHERNLWEELQEACNMFSWCINVDVPKICVENPVMHTHAKQRIAGYFEFTQSIQPWQFGHGETKRTCLWLKGLPPLAPTDIVDGRAAKVHKMPPSKDRWKARSRTYDGIGEAMAQQWGGDFDLVRL